MDLNMNCSLNSLKGGYIENDTGSYYRVIKGDTRSLDYSSHDVGKNLGPGIRFTYGGEVWG